MSMDGTCNGYQHLSAMGRDPIGGSATNLVPADRPEDIYQEVADHVSIRVMFDAEDARGARMQPENCLERSIVLSSSMRR